MRDHCGREVPECIEKYALQLGTTGNRVFRLDKPSMLFDHFPNKDEAYPDGVKVGESDGAYFIYGAYPSGAIVFSELRDDQVDKANRVAEDSLDELALFDLGPIQVIRMERPD